LELIVKTGISDAINQQLGGLKGDKNAIAETIENNVRRKIIKSHLNDPEFYEKMSTLLNEIIAARKAKAIEYEEFLKRIAELAKTLEAGKDEETPEQLNTPGQRALYNNLRVGAKPDGTAEERAEYSVPGDSVLALALRIDETIKQVRPDGWRGHQPKENAIKSALYGVLQDVVEVERIFRIIFEHKSEY